MLKYFYYFHNKDEYSKFLIRQNHNLGLGLETKNTHGKMTVFILIKVIEIPLKLLEKRILQKVI